MDRLLGILLQLHTERTFFLSKHILLIVCVIEFQQYLKKCG